MADPNKPSDASRRTFIKTGTAAVGGAMAALSMAPKVHAAGNDTLKIGLIGCGGRGSGAAINALRADDNVKLTVMADIFEDRERSMLQWFRCLQASHGLRR